MVKTGQKNESKILAWALSKTAGITKGGERILLSYDKDGNSIVPEDYDSELDAGVFKGQKQTVYVYVTAQTYRTKPE
jgi:hypothetical protein